MKQITVAGNIGQDATLHTSSDGREYLRFSLCVNERNRDGKDHPFWFSVFSYQVKLHPYLTRGTSVTVSGKYSDKIETVNGAIRISRTINHPAITLQGRAVMPASKPASKPAADHVAAPSDMPF